MDESTFKVVSSATVQAIKAAETKAEASTTAINNTVIENSQFTPAENLNASSKIVVDIPSRIRKDVLIWIGNGA